MNKLLAILGLLLTSTTYVEADSLAKANGKFCKKMKSCAVKDMRMENSSPSQAREIMKQMLDSLCLSAEQQYVDAHKNANLYETAKSCMLSMSKLSCEQLDANYTTTACKQAEKIQQQLKAKK